MIDRPVPQTELTLRDWQARLSQHFRELRIARGDWPIFALEHGLDQHEREALAACVQAAAIRHAPKDEERLPWIVYATEFGYRYSGESYWPAFEAATPGWRENADRSWLRRVFRLFATDFNGVIPQSIWAHHFTNICWPITHAILPKDLQQQLAEMLFHVRYLKSSFASAQGLGRYLHQTSYEGSSRFQELAENEELMGQIAAGLLLTGAGASSLILSSTLERIVEDIGRERAAQGWLAAARSRVRALHVHGLEQVRAHVGSPERARTVDFPELEANLSLVERSAGSWEPVLSIPSFLPIASGWPETRQFLETVRPFLCDGDEERPLARGKLISGSEERLKQWPAPNGPCLRVIDAPEPVAAAIEQLRFRVTGQAVFRVSDGSPAPQVSGDLVTPGRRYIVARRAEFTGNISFAAPVALSALGVNAIVIDIPEFIDPILEAGLAKLGLAPRRHMRIWPAGTVAAAWDDEGNCTYLIGDSVILAVAVDHEVTGLRIGVDAAPPIDVRWPQGIRDDTVFIDVGVLAAGQHKLGIDLFYPDRVARAGTLALSIRAPGATGRTAATCGALIVNRAPREPSLEALWERTVELSLGGPLGVTAQCTIALRERGGQLLGRVVQFGLQLPCTVPRWRECWKEKVLDNPAIAAHYDDAALCEVVITAGPLGQQRFVCRRLVTPLRWSVGPEDNRVHMTLLDDTGLAPLRVDFFPFERPDAGELIQDEAAVAGIDIRAPGGLVVARVAQQVAAVVVSPTARVRALASLSPQLTVRTLPREASRIADYVLVAGWWASANLRGSSQSALWRAPVVRALLMNVLGTVAGSRWRLLEARVMTGALDIDDLATWVCEDRLSMAAELIALVDRLRAATPHQLVESLTAVCRRRLRDECGRIQQGAPAEAIRAGVRRRLDQVRWLTEFSLRLCSAPDTLQSWSREHCVHGVQSLLTCPALLRAGRYTHLALSISGRHGEPTRGELWDW